MAEKFSKWRDPSTGVAPFLVPLPPNDVSLPPLLQAVTLPIAAVLGGVRTLLVILLLGAQFVLVEGVLQLFSFVPPLHFALSRAVNASIARLILIALGVLWIPVETVQLRKSGRSPPAIPFDPRKGDLILSNSSSYIDLLYLTFRYNATVLLPVSSSNKVVGYRRASLLSAILAVGQLPQQGGKAESLEEAIKKAAGPVVVFPEATTSNNRAMLKFAEIAPATAGKSSAVRTFVLTFRYPPPTRLAPSLTYPIPTPSPITGLLSHVYTLTSRLSPYTLTIRRLQPSESPKLSTAPKKEEWDALAETLAGTARLKRVGGLGWVEKGAFLEFRRVKGR
ncbi:lysophosphatidic acid acyltransferase LOA1 [Rhodotorula paludigena]|uniref:lysophosphatidic acid acyltransferase LOA1 n=1 Tax=Rhodotorula paludigena TaxID=86838 RepID=UPI00316E41F2